MQKVTLIGLDIDLLFLFVLTFFLWERVINKTHVGLLISYAIDQILVKIHQVAFKKNVAKKTMIDEDFML